jgi:hypothetical protein
MLYDTPENSDNIILYNTHIDQPSDFIAATSGSDNASVDMHDHIIETHPLSPALGHYLMAPG